jgi:hypothetical protein
MRNWVAALATVALVSALAATGASALPEIGRCVTQSGGKYRDANCTVKATLKAPGSYEWNKNAVNAGFTAVGDELRIEDVAGAEVHCGESSERGEYLIALSTKEAHHVVIAGTHCELPLVSGSCQTKGAAAGEIVSRALKGKLAYISGKHTPSVVVGQLLKPEVKSAPFREWECPAVAVSVREANGPENGHATVIATISPLNTMSSTFTEVYRGSEGAQEPQHTEGSTVIDNLEQSLSEGPFERDDQTGELTITNEEPLEIKA